MTSKEVGIEEGRKRLGDLVTAVQQGTDITLTRNGKPAARIVRYTEEDAMATVTLPPLSEGTTAAIANLVEYEIKREYGHDVAGPKAGAQAVALAGLTFDLRDEFVGLNGDDQGLRGYADTTLRILVRDGLTARLCQWRKLHRNALPCTGHYEDDVPAIDGALLCGTHHIQESETRNN